MQDALRWAAKQALNAADRARVAAGRHGAEPVPPRPVRARAGVPGGRDYVAGGRRTAAELEAALAVCGGAAPAAAGSAAPDGGGGAPGSGAVTDGGAAPDRATFAAAHSVLDLACGAGRVLRAVRERAPDTILTGCDVDAEAIAWARAHLPGTTWAVNRFDPPLPFADAAFDVVYSVSLFSHLDEPAQDAWLAAVARVLKPDGVALLTVHGEHAFEQFRTGAAGTRWCAPEAFARGPLDPDEFVYAPYARTRWNAAEMPGIDGSFGVAFHGAGYLRRRWSPVFDVLDILPRAVTDWQDVVVCRVRR